MTNKKEQLVASQPMTLDEPEDEADSQKAFADELLKAFPTSGDKAIAFAESLRSSGLVIKKARVTRDRSMPYQKDGRRVLESLSQTQTQNTPDGTEEPGKSGG